MDLQTLRSYLLAKQGAVEDFPFGPITLVMKVGNKMFALIGIDESPISITLKCDPQRALFLRDLYPAVRAGYHMNKDHWNTITIDGSIPDDELLAMIDESYKQVVKSLTKVERQKLAVSTASE